MLGDAVQRPLLALPGQDHQIAAQPLVQLLHQAVAEGGLQRTAEDRRGATPLVVGQVAMRGREPLQLVWIAQEQSNGAGLLQQVAAHQGFQRHRDLGLAGRQRAVGCLQRRCRGCGKGETTLSAFPQLHCEQLTGKSAAVVVANQQDAHRSLNQRESQPNPTTPSRTLRSMRRVR